MKTEIIMNERKLRFSVLARVRSFKYAMDGLRAFFASQHNAIIHLVFTAMAIMGAIIFPLSRMELAAVFLSIGFVWTAELFNTAIEKAMDIISTDYHPSIKFIKDVSAAAVLVSALAALATGLIVFLPKMF